MLNRYGFIPPKYRQPDSYQLIFENWVAVFIVGGCEYHVELAADWRNKKTAHSIDILCQGTKCRNTLVSGIPSIKQAMEKLETIVGLDKAVVMPKNCKVCGCVLVWENAYLPGHYHESSCNIEEWPVCHECMAEHCCQTNCFSCEYGKYPNCRFHDLKQHYMKED